MDEDQGTIFVPVPVEKDQEPIPYVIFVCNLNGQPVMAYA